MSIPGKIFKDFQQPDCGQCFFEFEDMATGATELYIIENGNYVALTTPSFDSYNFGNPSCGGCYVEFRNANIVTIYLWDSNDLVEILNPPQTIYVEITGSNCNSECVLVYRDTIQNNIISAIWNGTDLITMELPAGVSFAGTFCCSGLQLSQYLNSNGESSYYGFTGTDFVEVSFPAGATNIGVVSPGLNTCGCTFQYNTGTGLNIAAWDGTSLTIPPDQPQGITFVGPISNNGCNSCFTNFYSEATGLINYLWDGNTLTEFPIVGDDPTVSFSIYDNSCLEECVYKFGNILYTYDGTMYSEISGAPMELNFNDIIENACGCYFEYSTGSGDNRKFYIYENGTLVEVGGISESDCFCSVIDTNGEVETADVMSFAPEPLDNTICLGETVSFTVQVSNGTAPYTYQWQDGGGNMIGTNSATYSFTPTMADNGSTYQVMVTDNNGCSVMSESANLVINELPSLMVDDVSVCLGEEVSFTTTASNGAAPYNYQWQDSGGNTVGSNSETYTFTPTLTDNGTTYQVAVTDDNGCTVSSMPVTLTVNALPETSTPNDVTVCLGEEVSFTTTASNGAAPYNYQWQDSGGNTVGSDSETYTFFPLLADDGSSYQVIVTDDNGCINNSMSATLTINSLPDASFTCPINVPQCEGLFDLSPINSTGVWTGTSSNVIETNSMLDPSSLIQNVNYTLIYTITDNNGCQAQQSCNFNIINNCASNGGRFDDE